MSETVHIDFGVSKDCINHDSYGEICVQCNCCGRFNKETMWECRYNMYWQHLAETIEDHSFNYLQSNLQQSNIAKNVIYYGEKILECVSHIDFDKKKGADNEQREAD